MESFRVVIHGSFSKHFEEIKKARAIFQAAGIEVLAPKIGDITSYQDGFGLFDDEANQDPKLIELLYLHNLKQLGPNGFSFFVGWLTLPNIQRPSFSFFIEATEYYPLLGNELCHSLRNESPTSVVILVINGPNWR